MTKRFYNSITKIIKEKRKNFRLIIRGILGRRLVKGKYIIANGNLL